MSVLFVKLLDLHDVGYAISPLKYSVPRVQEQMFDCSLIGRFFVRNYFELLGLEVKFPLALRTDAVVSLDYL